MGLFDSIFKIGKDVVDIVAAPVEVAVDITRAVTKPIADAAKEIAEEIKADIDDGDDK